VKKELEQSMKENRVAHRHELAAATLLSFSS
jgi:hypothetical protein